MFGSVRNGMPVLLQAAGRLAPAAVSQRAKPAALRTAQWTFLSDPNLPRERVRQFLLKPGVAHQTWPQFKEAFRQFLADQPDMPDVPRPEDAWAVQISQLALLMQHTYDGLAADPDYGSDIQRPVASRNEAVATGPGSLVKVRCMEICAMCETYVGLLSARSGEAAALLERTHALAHQLGESQCGNTSELDIERLEERIADALPPSPAPTTAIRFGAAGLAPGMRALAHGGTLALANKESLVTAGPVLMATAARHGATILPVDSEHSAVFQALTGEDPAGVERVILTASGGPFRTWSAERMARATPAEAVAHPNWTMGQRISVDSASMFNKALELIETREYFGFDPEMIEAVVHPQSIVHSMVEFTDASTIAQLSTPDMRLPIGYALAWPDRIGTPFGRIDWTQIGRLDFEPPDLDTFPCLRLAYEAGRTGGTGPSRDSGPAEASASRGVMLPSVWMSSTRRS